MRSLGSLGRRLRSGATTFAVAAAVLALPACGAGGGGGDDGPPPAVSIQTTTLPTAGLAVPYSTVLAANGGTAPYAWALLSGSFLPPGLALSPTGSLSGTPTTLGTFGFSVSVTDAGSPAGTATASYVLVVSPFSFSVALLRFGEAWTNENYPLSAVGASSTTFTLVSNQSGASIIDGNLSDNVATYRAGPYPGTDRIRASSAAGVEELEVLVQTNPVATMTASFSSSDVWHVRFTGKFEGTHGFTSDFHWALSLMGLRAPTSTDSTGTTADQVAELYVRREVLAALNAHFLRDPDGTKGAVGLDITFPFDAPQAPYVSPANGNVARPAVNQFNVISMIGGGDSGVLGTAYLDDPDNGWQENDTTSAQGGKLGVFLDELVPIFNAAFNNKVLTAAPVDHADVPALKALLYGLQKPAGSRYDELRRVAQGFATTAATTLAHEIGHSLGLVHTSPSVAGSTMNPGSIISPSAQYAFLPADVTRLRNALPGSGRGGSPLRVEALRIAGPDEGDPVGLPVVCTSCRLLHR